VTKMSLTQQEYLRASTEPVPEELLSNIQELLRRMNALRQLYSRAMVVSSGYRSPDHNLMIGGAPNSKHLTGQAIDILDPTKRLAHWILNNLDTLANLELWCEDPRYTNGWIHFQTVPPKSGKRLFIP